MATKVPQRNPKERLLDANRTQKSAMRLRPWRASLTFPGAQIDFKGQFANISVVFVYFD
jgi:hypothetical protein